MPHPSATFPFGALVGQERMKLSLILNAVHPRIGGVLVRGERGTGKLTAVRALAGLLPEIEAIEGCPYSCDPGARGDLCADCRGLFQMGGPPPESSHRAVTVTVVPSSIMVEDLVGRPDGRGGYVPGLLARANRGILYAEGIDRMSDKASDALCSAAHAGTVVAAAGIVYPSRFVLAASIDRPRERVTSALLDRFGLCVGAETIHERDDRLRILQYHGAFDADPSAFLEKFEPDQARLRDRIARAIAALPGVRLNDVILDRIAAFCEAAGIEGHRADVAVARAARAVAAFDGRSDVRDDDVHAALELAMPHRLEARPGGGNGGDTPSRRKFLDAVGDGAQTASETIQKLWTQTSRAAPAADLPRSPPEPSPEPPPPPRPAAPAAGPKDDWVEADGRSGRRGGRGRGRSDEKRRPEEATQAPPPAMAPTVEPAPAPAPQIECLPSDAAGSRRTDGSTLLPSDARRERSPKLVILVADTSGVGAGRRAEAARETIVQLAESLPGPRDLVSLITVRGDAASLALGPTRDAAAAQKKLRNLPTGGKTPLPDGLVRALTLARAEIRKDSEIHPLIVLFAEGRANVSKGDNVMVDLEEAAAAVAKNGFPTIVIDPEGKGTREGMAKSLALRLRAAYLPLKEPDAREMVTIIRDALDRLG